MIDALAAIDASMAPLRAYREASMEDRCAMIRTHYARLDAERIERYERRHGPGSAARHRAEALARPMPETLSVAFQRPSDRFGFWEYGRG